MKTEKVYPKNEHHEFTMKLKRFSYKEQDWSIDNLHLNDVNLIVGENAVGKSRTTKALSDFAQILLQQKDPSRYSEFSFNVEFSILNGTLSYSFTYNEGIVIFEKLQVNDIIYIERDQNGTSLKSTSAEEKESITPPANKLTVHVRRDIIEYPFTELLVNWAENSYGLKFGQIVPVANIETGSFGLLSRSESMYQMYKQLDKDSQNNIITNLSNINYNINKITPKELSENTKILGINEEGVKELLWEGSLSQGLLRTLFFLIFIEYLLTKKGPQTIVIDDFCEGLDYNRSIKLGHYIYDFCLKNQIQLIATSNDSFLMDVVDLQYWNILQRQGSVVTAISKFTNPLLVEEFEFTGLTNFDFFSSDFIARHKK